jgi:ABC-type metal ion transport system, periplasmic component/surface adhesin
VWLDPTRMITITRALADALAAEDPAQANAIQQRADAYIRELEVLDAEIAELLAPYEGAAFIPFHDAWPYFAERYGLQLVMEIEPFPGREPTARQLAAAIAIIEEYGATAIFSEVQLPDRPAQVLADEAGVALGILDPLGGSEARPTYHDLVRYNAQVIADTLTPTQP